MLSSVGNQIGVGKESDVYVGLGPDGSELVVKLHRLGRTSFRKVKEKRDYHGKRRSPNWLYLARLAALKEHAFMAALAKEGFPVPQPLGLNRHVVVMSLVPGLPLSRVAAVPDPAALHAALLDLLIRLASVGLIHSDFNEFNILIKEADAAPVLIDFPQMVSTSHANAAMFSPFYSAPSGQRGYLVSWLRYFDRDVTCVSEFFRKRFGFDTEDKPTLDDIEFALHLNFRLGS